MKHTEGEHHAVNYAGYWELQSGPYYGDTDLLNEDTCPDAEANAKLYAAAPELLKALILIKTTMLKKGVNYDNADTYNIIDAAIKKATT